MIQVTTLPSVLTIAGSDSAGCAGLQADLKTLAALQVHGFTAVTAVTAQDAHRVFSVTPLPPSAVVDQIDAILGGPGAEAVKTGMLYSRKLVQVVADRLRHYAVAKLVIDPVMTSSGNFPLLCPRALETLRRRLFPLALIVTPNLPEAERLVGRRLVTARDIELAAQEIRTWGPAAVLVKGGHASGVDCCDILVCEDQVLSLKAPRQVAISTRGSGCTLASAIAAHLAWGVELENAVRLAKRFVSKAIEGAQSLKDGPGPLGHLATTHQ